MSVSLKHVVATYVAVGVLGLSTAGCAAKTYVVLPASSTPTPTVAEVVATPPAVLLNGVYTTMAGPTEAQWTIKSDCGAAGCTATVSSSNGGWTGNAMLTGNQWDITVERPNGVSCKNGTTKPSTNHYSWDAVTFKGTVDSSYGAVCNGEPPGNYHADFSIEPTPISTLS